jgi:predicted nucleotidyltransferase
MQKNTTHCAGIIVEFNPLHNGHIEHINETRRITGRENIIAVMSGNFVQRGEPVLCDKWRRTKMALLAGVAVVIELPLLYVLGGADFFARGAVGLLAASGVVDCLCFGSESGNIEAIKKGGHILAEEPPVYKETLRKALDAGKSFAAARGAALEKALAFLPNKIETSELTTKPNNGLGMEYCKALELSGSPMEVYTSYRRQGGASATAIRKAFHSGDSAAGLKESAMPPYAREILTEAAEKGETVHINNFSEIFRYLINGNNAPVLDEGLHNRFRKSAMRHTSLTDLLAAVKTKRYTLTRLQRTAMRILLGITPEYEPPAYIRILGFRKESAQLVGEITRRASVPVLTHGAAMDNFSHRMLVKELEAGDIYQLAYKNGFTRNERGMEIVRV